MLRLFWGLLFSAVVLPSKGGGANNVVDDVSCHFCQLHLWFRITCILRCYRGDGIAEGVCRGVVWRSRGLIFCLKSGLGHCCAVEKVGRCVCKHVKIIADLDPKRRPLKTEIITITPLYPPETPCCYHQ